MKAILCPECGHEINKHMDIYSPVTVCHGTDGKNFCKCMLTPQEIAAYHIINTLRKIEDLEDLSYDQIDLSQSSTQE